MKVHVEQNPGTAKPWVLDFKYFRDGTRVHWSGQTLGVLADGSVERHGSLLIEDIVTDQAYILVGPVPQFGKPQALVVDNARAETFMKGQEDHPNRGGPLNGRIYGNNGKSVIQLLREAPDPSIRSSSEIVNGVACQVIEGATPYGKVAAWIAPEKGYALLKWTLVKAPGDLFDGNRLEGQGPKALKHWVATFEADGVEQIDDSFVVTGGRFDISAAAEGSPDVPGTYVYKREQIVLHPDFEALGAFVLKVPDGTRVQYNDYPSVPYEWRGGKIVPRVDRQEVASLDNTIAELLQQAPTTQEAGVTAAGKEPGPGKEPPAARGNPVAAQDAGTGSSVARIAWSSAVVLAGVVLYLGSRLWRHR